MLRVESEVRKYSARTALTRRVPPRSAATLRARCHGSIRNLRKAPPRARCPTTRRSARPWKTVAGGRRGPSGTRWRGFGTSCARTDPTWVATSRNAPPGEACGPCHRPTWGSAAQRAWSSSGDQVMQSRVDTVSRETERSASDARV